MDWITLSRRDIEQDALPEVCVHCGKPALGRYNHTFKWKPRWLRWLYYCGYLPGAVVASVISRRMRVSLPACSQHLGASGGRSSLMAMLLVFVGWLVLPALGAAAVMAFLAPVAGVAEGIVAGFALWLGLVFLFAKRGKARPKRLVVRKINAEGIALEGVADNFVHAVKDRQRRAGLPPPLVHRGAS